MLRVAGGLLSILLLAGCVHDESFVWPEHAEAIPDEKTAILTSLAIFQGQARRDLGDLRLLAPKLEAYRYRTSDGSHDPKGDAWLIHMTAKEEADFNARCAGNCVGGEFYIMALSAHNGRVLELYIPQ